MKTNFKYDKPLFVYNLALRRGDGRIEQDTVYREKLFTREEVAEIAKKYICSVLVSCVGTFVQGGEKFINENSFYVDLPKPVEVDNGNE